MSLLCSSPSKETQKEGRSCPSLFPVTIMMDIAMAIGIKTVYDFMIETPVL